MNNCQLLAYHAPSWAGRLRAIPGHKVKLAMLPTPIQRWNIPNIFSNFEIFIKRDDMTGNLLSGNKVRKLEFLLADALNQGCKSVITCGGVQSNHCRATAVAARELGLDCHLLLRSGKMNDENVDEPGNLLPSIFCGSRVYFIRKNSKYLSDIKPKQELLAKQLKESTGSPAYCIPVGGSNVVGVFGYIEAWDELMNQNICENVDDIVLACGSGGSVAGLAVGNYLTGQKIKIHAISVSDDSTYFHNHVNEMLSDLGMNDVQSEDLVDMIDGYKGAGYGKSTEEDHDLLQKIASSTGIICDPVYTGKAVKGMLAELEKNPGRFQGNRVMFLHTGGVYSLYDGTMKRNLQRSFQEKAYVWQDDSPAPQKLYS